MQQLSLFEIRSIKKTPTYRLVRSRRRSLSILIERDGSLVMRAPMRYPLYKIDDFFRSKLPWIKKHVLEIETKQRKEKQFISGEKFLFLGKNYPLLITPAAKNSLVFRDTDFHFQAGDPSKAGDHFRSWYRRQALKIFKERASSLARDHQLPPQDVRISKAKYQWGSCSPDNILRLNWRLVLAPLPVIDYVIAHEIAHIKYKSHGIRFWGLVEKIYPGYQKPKSWLKENGYLLSL